MRHERSGLHLLAEQPLVVVLDAQPPLGGDHAAFAFDDLRHEREIGDAVGFEIEHQIEGAARKPVLVDGDVVAREGVVGASLGFHQAVELPRLPAGRAVEHHVLEEVRESRDAGRFVAAAGAHPVVEGDVRDVVHRPDDDSESVGKPQRAHRIAARRCGSGRGGGRGQGAKRRQRGGVAFVHTRQHKKSAASGGSRIAALKERTPGKLFAIRSAKQTTPA